MESKNIYLNALLQELLTVVNWHQKDCTKSMNKMQM